MKIISWNCCLNLSKKFDKIKKLNPDILIIQECEELPEDFFPNAKYYRTGHTKNKGIGVVLFDNVAEIAPSFNNKLDYFLPLNLDNGIRLLALWSFTHRAAGRFGEGHVGHVSDAIEYYRDWLESAEKAIISGDFNNSVIWDKGDKESNFKNTNLALESIGFKSSYHKLNNEEFGKEKRATLYHTKNKDKTYHIDYVYLKGLEPKEIEVGSYADWIQFSDHVPVIVNI
jgi:exonuclease III